MRMHDADSSSPTTEQNRENVFQLILHINFFFFLATYTIDAIQHTEDDGIGHILTERLWVKSTA